MPRRNPSRARRVPSRLDDYEDGEKCVSDEEKATVARKIKKKVKSLRERGREFLGRKSKKKAKKQKKLRRPISIPNAFRKHFYKQGKKLKFYNRLRKFAEKKGIVEHSMMGMINSHLSVVMKTIAKFDIDPESSANLKAKKKEIVTQIQGFLKTEKIKPRAVSEISKKEAEYLVDLYMTARDESLRDKQEKLTELQKMKNPKRKSDVEAILLYSKQTFSTTIRKVADKLLIDYALLARARARRSKKSR